MAEGRPRGPIRPGLAYSFGCLVLLLLAWNIFASGFSGDDQKRWVVHGSYRADGSEGTHLAGLLEQLPAHGTRPRLLVLGNSQMKTVKREPIEDRRLGVGGQLAKRLPGLDVVDLSSGGQQTVESLVVLAHAVERVEPDAVVLGVGAFSMGKATVRPRLAAELTSNETLARSLRGAPEDWVSLTAPILERLGPPDAGATDSGRSQTIQARMDTRLGGWLDALPAVRYRTALYDELIDEPLRRNLMRWLAERVGKTRLARTVVLTSGFETSIAALGLAARICEQRGIPFLLVVMPYDTSREPIIYPPEETARLRQALEALPVARLVDLGDALAPEQFGDFVDGSRDALHFDRAGHRRLSEILAPIIRASMLRAESS